MCCEPKDTTRPDSDVPQWAKDAARELMEFAAVYTQATEELAINHAAIIISKHARRAAFGLERVRDTQQAREWLNEMGFGGEK